ncbi:MAG: hypothetical protein C0500_10200 [Sphingobium sp.]|nr:hypothetical protein [Sphingobium sp.]
MLSGGDEHADGLIAWGNDQLFGGADDDIFVPGYGNDLFHGGDFSGKSATAAELNADGSDSISYAGLPADGKKGIRIDVTAAPKDMTFKDTPDIAHAVYVTDLARDKDTDTLISIEKIIGSGANDILAISTFDAARIATYNSTDDTHSSGLFEVDLGGQAERGADLIDFSGLTAGVGVHFDDARPWVSLLSDDAHRLYVAGAEQVLGGSGDDEFYGGNANEVFAGGEGNDLIHGGSGRDFIFGGAGMDRLYGDGGNDKIVVGNNGHIDGTGGTFVDGGAGNDTIFILRAAERPSSDSAATTTLANAATITLANGDAGDRIVWNGHELTGGTFKVIVNPNADGDGVGLIIPIADYVGALGEIYSWRPGQQTLTINLPDMTMLSIAFDNGDYGLTFAAPPANEFAPSVPRSAAASLPNTATIIERFDAIEGRHAAFDSVGQTNAPRAPEPGQAGAQPADSSAPAAAFMLASDEAALFSLLATDYFAPAHDLTDITSLAA